VDKVIRSLNIWGQNHNYELPDGLEKAAREWGIGNRAFHLAGRFNRKMSANVLAVGLICRSQYIMESNLVKVYFNDESEISQLIIMSP